MTTVAKIQEVPSYSLLADSSCAPPYDKQPGDDPRAAFDAVLAYVNHGAPKVSRAKWELAFDMIAGNDAGAVNRKQWHLAGLASEFFEVLNGRCGQTMTRVKWQQTYARVDEIMSVRSILPINTDGAPPRRLQAFPDVDVKAYVRSKQFWQINLNFPGLRAVSADPWVFVVPDLLTLAQCEALIEKTQLHLHRDMMPNSAALKGLGEIRMEVDNQRTSSGVRVPHTEIPRIQATFANLLNTDVSNMETVKVMRYEKDQEFKTHHDGPSRFVTLFVYLNTCASGGATKFPKIMVKNKTLEFKPVQGMGVIHFPTFLPGSVEFEEHGARDIRTVHAGNPAKDEKWLCAQWIAADPQRDEALIAHEHLSDTIL